MENQKKKKKKLFLSNLDFFLLNWGKNILIGIGNGSEFHVIEGPDVPGNSYGHVGTVSSPNHSFFPGKLEQAVNQYFVHILSLVTDNPS